MRDGGDVPLPGSGRDYESAALVAGGFAPEVSGLLLTELDTFNQALAQGQYGLAQGTLGQMALYVVQQRGRTVPTGTADQLLAAFLLAEFLLIPRP